MNIAAPCLRYYVSEAVESGKPIVANNIQGKFLGRNDTLGAMVFSCLNPECAEVGGPVVEREGQVATGKVSSGIAACKYFGEGGE